MSGVSEPVTFTLCPMRLHIVEVQTGYRRVCRLLECDTHSGTQRGILTHTVECDTQGILTHTVAHRAIDQGALCPVCLH